MEKEVKVSKTLIIAKEITVICITESKIPQECKDRMLKDIEVQKTLLQFLKWFYNDILAFEDCRVIK